MILVGGNDFSGTERGAMSFYVSNDLQTRAYGIKWGGSMANYKLLSQIQILNNTHVFYILTDEQKNDKAEFYGIVNV